MEGGDGNGRRGRKWERGAGMERAAGAADLCYNFREKDIERKGKAAR